MEGHGEVAGWPGYAGLQRTSRRQIERDVAGLVRFCRVRSAVGSFAAPPKAANRPGIGCPDFLPTQVSETAPWLLMAPHGETWARNLLRDHATRDPGAAAEAGLGFGGDALIGIGVDDDRRAVRVEDGQ
jgi:hypothetical protein